MKVICIAQIESNGLIQPPQIGNTYEVIGETFEDGAKAYFLKEYASVGMFRIRFEATAFRVVESKTVLTVSIGDRMLANHNQNQ